MKKFFIFSMLILSVSFIQAQTTPSKKGFGYARLDSLSRIEKHLIVDIDSCTMQISRFPDDTQDIEKRLEVSKQNLINIQKQMHYIKQIKGIKPKN
ncbi:MAG: hypothetical protein ACK5N8_07525 [Alphaproteobacteria bacterium]